MTAARSLRVSERPSVVFVVGDDGCCFGGDLCCSFAPRGHDFFRDAEDFRLPVRRRCSEHNAEPGVQFGAQCCLVEDAGGFLVMEQLMPVDGAPDPVRAQEFVRDQGVGVQLRIPGPRRPVVEQGGGEPAGADLLDTVGAAPRQRRMAVEVGEGGEDCGAVCLRDLGLRGRTAQRPQHADALGGREGEVEAGDRIRPPRPTECLAR